MTVRCDHCGKAITRSRPREHNFCCVECRNRWKSQHVDYSVLSRGHRAQHLTELNKERNPHLIARLSHERNLFCLPRQERFLSSFFLVCIATASCLLIFRPQDIMLTR